MTTLDLRRLPITFDLRAVSVEEGVRAGLSVAALVVADSLLHQPILLEAALGALLTCLCDAGGLVRRRVPALLAFAAIGGLLIGGLGLLRPLGYGLIPLACFGIFCFSFVRIYNQTAQQVGTLLCVVLVLALDRSLPDVHAALLVAGAFVGGSLWALLLTVAIWRLHPNRPARQAVARVYLALAELAEDLAVLSQAAGPDGAWERHARAHRRRVRELIETARGMLNERLRAGSTAASPAAQGLLRLEAADQMFAALIALSDLLEGAPATPEGAAHSAAVTLPRLAAALRALAPHVVDQSDSGLAAVEVAIGGLAAQARLLPAGTALRGILERVVERLRATVNLSDSVAPEMRDGRLQAAPWTDRVLAPLRANLQGASAALRHAARAALVSGAGFVITFTWPTSYQHWLTLTLVLTLQPYYALTLQRALERIGGTVLGGLVAAALGLVCRTPVEIAAAVLPLSVIALSVRAVNFGLYITALTPMIVLLVELVIPAHGHFSVALMRAVYTVIGGMLAVLGCVFLWPSWEPGRLEQELRAAIRCHARYADVVLALLQDAGCAGEADAARRAAGMASNNLEASLARALLEPTRSGRERLGAAMVVDTALRRIAARLTAMQLDPAVGGGVALIRWREWIRTAMAMLDESLPPPLPERPAELPAVPALRESLIRIGRQLDLSAGALRRYGES